MKYFFLLLSVLLTSCASYKESVKALEEMHREPVAFYPSFGPQRLEYNVHEEEPVEFCLEQILDLANYSYDNEMEKSEALVVLSVTARRSPAQLVRASAVRALRMIFQDQTAPFMPTGEPADPEECKERLLALRKGAHEGEAAEIKGSRLYYFSNTAFGSAHTACMVIDQVIVQTGSREEEDSVREAYMETAARLNLQAFYLTVQETLMDREEVVRAEALEALFCFSWIVVQPTLTQALEYNPLLHLPIHANRIMKYLYKMAEDPEDLGIGIMKHLNDYLASPQSGVVKHAIDVFVKVTKIQEDDPRFWEDWWEEYLLLHAGDEEKAEE